MKTFVTDDYQVTLRDNGGVKVLIKRADNYTRIIYDPDSKPNKWSYWIAPYWFGESNSITDFEIPATLLKKLRKALELVGKQDLFDKEIVFVNKENN